MQNTIKMSLSSKDEFKKFQLDGESADDSLNRLLDNVEGRMPQDIPLERVSNISVHPDTLDRLKRFRVGRESMESIILRAISLYSDE